MTVGIYAGDSRLLGLQECFPRLHAYFHRIGQPTLLRCLLKSALPSGSGSDQPTGRDHKVEISEELRAVGMYSFPRGLQQLPDHIVSYLQENYPDRFQLHLNTSIMEIEKSLGQEGLSIGLEGAHSSSQKICHLFNSLPAKATAQILEQSKSLGDTSHSQKLLRSIPTVDVAVIQLAWEGTIPMSHKGFGYLVAPETNQKILGVTFDSQNFPEHLQGQQQTRMTVMMGGAPSLGMRLEDYSLSDLKSMASETVQRHLQLSEPPTSIHGHVYKQAIPQYYVSLLQELD